MVKVLILLFLMYFFSFYHCLLGKEFAKLLTLLFQKPTPRCPPHVLVTLTLPHLYKPTPYRILRKQVKGKWSIPVFKQCMIVIVYMAFSSTFSYLTKVLPRENLRITITKCLCKKTVLYFNCLSSAFGVLFTVWVLCKFIKVNKLNIPEITCNLTSR